MPTITDREVQGAISKARKTGRDVFITDEGKARGMGRLRVRARPTGACLFYYRYTDSAGASKSLPLGTYSERGEGGLSLKDAFQRSGDLSRRYQAGERDLHAVLDHEQAEQHTARETAARERAETERQATAGSLQALLTAYVEHTKRRGKASWREARNLFQHNIFDDKEAKRFATVPARDMTREDAAAIIALVVNRGAGRSAGKLRSYMRAAFACALEAEGDPTMHAALHGFHLGSNPVAAVSSKSLAQFNRAGKRALNDSELRGYMAELDAMQPSATRDVLRLCLLLGGQRLAQLARVRPLDVDADERCITIWDAKGARQEPREHVIPLTDRAWAIVAPHLELRDAEGNALPYLLTNDARAPVHSSTLSDEAREICKRMLTAKTAREPFQLRDVRRTCETMLARMGISRDHRAQILSHGIGGVQDRHYDRHDYMDEKRRALEAWDARLIEIASGKPRKNVINLQSRTAIAGANA